MDQVLTLQKDFAVSAKFRVSGKVEGVFRTGSEERFETFPADALELTFKGIPGDRHSGFTRRSGAREPWYPRGTEMCNERQISLLSVEELRLIAERMALPEILPEWIGGNFLLSGLPNLTRIPPRTRLVFEGGAVVRVDGENLPCRSAGAGVGANYPDREGLDLLFPKEARGLRGLVGYVEKPGTVRAGEGVTAHIPEQWIYETV